MMLGSGSLMDGLTFGVPTVLVPNPSLLNNHQEELAQEAEKAGYCIRGDLK
jgi:beta-1,4-N-acetylglucosaminyltransferase